MIPMTAPGADERPPTMAAIGRALGLTRQAVSAAAREGMPTHSIEAAHEWRCRNLDPARRKRGTFDEELRIRSFLASAHELMAAAADALAHGRELAFAALEPALREARRSVPEPARGRVAFLPPVLGRLLAGLSAFEEQLEVEEARRMAAGGEPEDGWDPDFDLAEFQRRRAHEPPTGLNFMIASGELDHLL